MTICDSALILIVDGSTVHRTSPHLHLVSFSDSQGTQFGSKSNDTTVVWSGHASQDVEFCVAMAMSVINVRKRSDGDGCEMAATIKGCMLEKSRNRQVSAQSRGVLTTTMCSEPDEFYLYFNI